MPLAIRSDRPRKPKQERIDALNAAMKDVENVSAANRKAAVTRLDELAAELAKDAATAMGNTAARMRACASTIQKRNAQVR